MCFKCRKVGNVRKYRNNGSVIKEEIRQLLTDLEEAESVVPTEDKNEERKREGEKKSPKRKRKK